MLSGARPSGRDQPAQDEGRRCSRLLAAVIFLHLRRRSSRTWLGRAAYAYRAEPRSGHADGRENRAPANRGRASTRGRSPASAARSMPASTRSSRRWAALYILKGVEAAILGGIG